MATKNKKLKILMIATECTPIAKAGGLGDVIGALPKALTQLGHEIRIVIPKYLCIDLEKYHFQKVINDTKIALPNGKSEKVNIYRSFYLKP